VAQPKMEWRLNHVGQMAQSVQDYSYLLTEGKRTSTTPIYRDVYEA